MQIGLKPNELLDMSLDTLKACISGYSDRLLDMQILGVQQGYWAGYYSRAKKPKSVKSIIRTLLQTKSEKQTKNYSVEKPDVNVDAFLNMENQFKERYNKLHQ